jgi:hypothetical protein
VTEGLVWAAKALAIWAALLAGSIAGTLLVRLPPGAPGDGPLDIGQAFLAVNALFAVVLASLSCRLTGPFWQRTATLFLLLYLVETLLSIVESLFFGAFLNLPEGLLGGLAVVNAVKSALAALVAAALWRGEGEAAAIGGLAWKLPAVVLLYIMLYFGAGQFIAWQSAAVRAYYGQGLAIDTGRLVLLQVGRGAVWAGLAWLLARTLRAPPLAKALLSGAAFAILMAGPLLYPNALMPWGVRQVHLVEIGVSNFLFGLLAVWLLSWSGTHDQGEGGTVRRTA